MHCFFTVSIHDGHAPNPHPTQTENPKNIIKSQKFDEKSQAPSCINMHNGTKQICVQIWRKMINTLAILSPASPIAMTSTAIAEGCGGGEGERFPKFSKLDLNGDKRISKEEITACVKARLASVDQSNDGTLSTEERIAQHGKA